MTRTLSQRTELEERSSQAKAAWRRARAQLSAIETKLGQRALDVEERLERRARMKPWLRSLLAWVGALPHDTDDRNWQAARSEIETQKLAVAAVERELDELRQLESARGEPLSLLGSRLDRSRQYVEQLDAAHEVALEGRERALAAVALFLDAEASTHQENQGDDEGAQYARTAELLKQAGARLTDASAQFSLCNESTLAGVLLDIGSRAAAAGMWESASGTHDLVTLAALRESTATALEVASAFLTRLAAEITRARTDLETLRAQRDEHLRAMTP